MHWSFICGFWGEADIPALQLQKGATGEMESLHLLDLSEHIRTTAVCGLWSVVSSLLACISKIGLNALKCFLNKLSHNLEGLHVHLEDRTGIPEGLGI